MIDFNDFCKMVRKDSVHVYPDGLENVGFYFRADESTGIELVRVGVAFFDSSECLLDSSHVSALVTFDKAWAIYFNSLRKC